MSAPFAVIGSFARLCTQSIFHHQRRWAPSGLQFRRLFLGYLLLFAISSLMTLASGRVSATTQQAPNTTPGFVRGINLNGGAVTVEGNPWLSYTQALQSGLSVTDASTWTWSVPHTPAVDADMQHMLDGGLWRPSPANGEGFSLAQPLPNGDYSVYLWMNEIYIDYYRNVDVKLEGTKVATGIGELPYGQWKKYGPYDISVTDGELNLELLRVSKGDPLLCGLAIFNASTGGNASPSVQLTSPADGATLPSGTTLTLAATASDRDGSIAKVEFFQNETKLGEDTTSPYSFDWTNPPAGSYTLTARATDDGGVTTTSTPISVTLTADHTPGFVRGINLNGGAVTIEGNRWLSYSQALQSGLSVTDASTWTWSVPHTPAVDADTQHMLDGGLWRPSPPNGEGFSLAQTLPNGNYSIYLWMNEIYVDYYRNVNVKLEGEIIATGIGELPYGQWKKYGPYEVSVTDGVLNLDLLRMTKGDPLLCGVAIFQNASGTNNAPTVQLTSPTNGVTLPSGATVTLAATATDRDGSIAKVEFFQNETKLGEDTTSPYSFDWTNPPAGSYTLTAKATDDGGASTISAPISVTLTADHTPGFVRGINLNGGAVTIEGNPWLSYSQALESGLSVTDASTWTWSVPHTPAVDADTQHMLDGGLWRPSPPNGEGFSLAQTLPNGNYYVYLWMSEIYIDQYRNVDVRLEGTGAATGIGELPYGQWKKYGPYEVSVTDGVLNLDLLRMTKGDPLLCGVAIFHDPNGNNASPSVQLTSPADGATFPSGVPLTLSATASDRDGSIAKVEFFQNGTKLGEDTTSPYSLNWNTPIAGNYALTAKAWDNLGATTTSAPLSLTFTANYTPGYVRGINLNGNAVTVEGNPWLSYTQALQSGLCVTNASTWAWSISLSPTPDADTQHMLDGGLWRPSPANGEGFGLAQTLPNGNYHVYLWMNEIYVDYYRNANVLLEGARVATGIGDLPYGQWKKYGPYDVSVTDGVLNLDVLRTSKGDPVLCGVAIFSGHAQAPRPIKVMPMGDSLTYGVYGSFDFGEGGYRRDLWQRLQPDGWNVDFVGSVKSGVDDFDRDHEGHNGWTIANALESIDDWLASWEPEVILLNLGVNDLMQGASTDVAATRLEALLDRIIAHAPNTDIVVSSLTRARDPNDYIQPQRIIDFNARIPAIVSARAASGHKVRYLDLYSQSNLLDSDFSADGLHLNASGYGKVAEVWYGALTPVLQER